MDLQSLLSHAPTGATILISLIVSLCGVVGAVLGYRGVVKKIDATVETKTLTTITEHEHTFRQDLMKRVEALHRQVEACEDRHNAERKKRLELEDLVIELRGQVNQLKLQLQKAGETPA